MGRKKVINLIGKKIGMLSIIKEVDRVVYPSGIKCRRYLCDCDCGNQKIVLIAHLMRKQGTRSCGCKKRCSNGLSNTRLYSIWVNMNHRCNNIKNEKYDYYGGRGIKCLWRSIQDFIDDMSDSYNSHIEINGVSNTTLDRIDNDGNYCKENCKRATRKEQANNTRSNNILVYKGKTQTLAQRSRDFGIHKGTLYGRIFVWGWSIERALETPVDKRYATKYRK